MKMFLQSECRSTRLLYVNILIDPPAALQALSAGIQNRSPKPGPTGQDLELGYFLETGLQRAHVIHFKNG